MMINRLMRRTVLALTIALLTACTEDMTAPDTESTTTVPPGAELAALSGSWTTKANYPEIATGGSALAMVPNAQGQSMLYVIAGQSSSGGPVSRVRVYNVATNSWSRRAEYPITAYNTNGAAVIKGKIYVSGGVRDFHFYRSQLYMYDPATNEWTEKRSMPTPTWGGITGVINNKLYVLTCVHQEDCFTLNEGLELYRYDPLTDQWTDLGTSPPQGVRPMGGTIGGKLYFTGGENERSGPLMTAYDPITNQWTRKTPLNHVRIEGGFATYNARLYIFGGWETPGDGTRTFVRTVNIYNPTNNAWSKATPLPTARSGHSAQRVFLNGKPRIEVVGGAKPDNLQFTP